MSEKIKLPINYDKCHWSVRKKARIEYIKHQNGLCYHCNSKLHSGPSKKVKNMKIDKSLFPKTFFKNPIHLHHCHKTGMSIGAVHAHCNAVLWQYFGE